MRHAFPPESFQREHRTTFSKYHFFPGIFQWNARNFLVNEKRTECCDLLKRVLRLHFDNSPIYKQGNWAELTLAKTSGKVYDLYLNHIMYKLLELMRRIDGIHWDIEGLLLTFLEKHRGRCFFLLTALMFGLRTPRRDTRNMAFPYKAL